MLLEVGTGATTAGTRAPVNLALVVDRSGSMKGNRLRNAISGATGWQLSAKEYAELIHGVSSGKPFVGKVEDPGLPWRVMIPTGWACIRSVFVPTVQGIYAMHGGHAGPWKEWAVGSRRAGFGLAWVT